MGEAAGGVSEHHDGENMERHLSSVMERAGRKFGRVSGDFADGVFAELEEFSSGRIELEHGFCLRTKLGRNLGAKRLF